MFFAVPAPGVAAEILAPNGGNVAPFMYTALIWLTRYRPNWCGFFFGLGFLQREFTLYAGLALFGVELVSGELLTRDGIRRRLTMLRAAVEVWLVVHILKSYSSAAGPGTTTADLMQSGESAVEFAKRFCTDPPMIPRGLRNLFSSTSRLFGTRPMGLNELAIESTIRQGFSGAWIVLALTGAHRGRRHRRLTSSESADGNPPTPSAPIWCWSRCCPRPATSSAAAAGCITSRCATSCCRSSA